MKTKQKYAIPLALIFAFTAILIIQPLAARDIIPGQTIQGELGDGDDIISENDRRYDIFTFEAQPNESYKITLVSEGFAAASAIGLQAGTLQVAYVPTPSYQVQYSGTFKTAEQATISVWSTNWQSIQTGKYTLNLEITPPEDGPLGGIWSEDGVAFYVAEDGSKITWEGSNLLTPLDESVALKIGPIGGSGGCKNFKITVFYKTIIPIVDGGFNYSDRDEELTMNGTFTSETTSEGQLSAEYDGGASCSGNFKKSGSWKARATSTANRIRPTTNAGTFSDYITHDYDPETGKLNRIKVYQLVIE